MKAIIGHFSRSEAAHTRLTEERGKLGVRFGLQKVSKTRFGSIYWSTISVVDCFSIIQSLASEGLVPIKVCLQCFFQLPAYYYYYCAGRRKKSPLSSVLLEVRGIDSAARQMKLLTFLPLSHVPFCALNRLTAHLPMSCFSGLRPVPGTGVCCKILTLILMTPHGRL